MSNILFEREFIVEDMPPIAVVVFEPIELGQIWNCRHEISWHDGVRSYNNNGTDKLHAVVLCLSMIEAELIEKSEQLEKKITWLGDERLGLIWADWQRLK